MDKNGKAAIIVRLSNDVLLHDNSDSAPSLTTAEWNEVLEMASTQGVLPMLIHQLNKTNPTGRTPVGKKQLLSWIGVALQNEQNYRLRVEIMRKVARLFGKENIDIMFLKGASLAQLYPCPAWRVFSDIDYYLYRDSEKGIKLMAEYGIKSSDYYHHHTQASLSGVLLENHYDFVERINHKCDIMIDDALKEIAAKEGHSVKAMFLGENVSNAYLMTPTMSAIFLIRHMSAHFASETVTFRMLYDWALFLQHYADEVDWKYVLQLYERSGMMKFAGIIMAVLKTHMAFECLACPLELGNLSDAEKVWDSIINPPDSNPYARLSMRNVLFEAKTFFDNRWKHELVYPEESFVMLFFKYSWLVTKRKMGLLLKQNDRQNTQEASDVHLRSRPGESHRHEPRTGPSVQAD